MPNNKTVADTQGKKLKRAEYLTYLKKKKEELMQEKEIKNLESEIHNLTLDLNDEGHVTYNRYENERQQQTGFTFKTQRDYRNTDQDHVTLEQLRTKQTLDREVGKHMQHLLKYSRFYDEDEYMCNTTEGKKVNIKPIKSGRTVKVTDNVAKQLVWSHARLNMEFASRDIDYEQLTPFLFVAGYLDFLNLIDMDKDEIKLRIQYLKSLMYNAEISEWDSILDLNAAVYTTIERGDKDWSDSFLNLEARFLRNRRQSKTKMVHVHNAKQYTPTTQNTQTVQENISFCKPYQANKCGFKQASHQTVIAGRKFTAHHICASCWLTDRVKMEHPECSDQCKYHGQPTISNK